MSAFFFLFFPFFVLFILIRKLAHQFYVFSDWCNEFAQILICQELEESLDKLWHIIREGNLAELGEAYLTTGHVFDVVVELTSAVVNRMLVFFVSHCFKQVIALVSVREHIRNGRTELFLHGLQEFSVRY